MKLNILSIVWYNFIMLYLSLGSLDFYILLIDLHAYSEVFATEPVIQLTRQN